MHFITKTFNPGKGYSCVFRQARAKSHCRLAHGYDLIFGITLGAEELDENGWVFDFGALKPIDALIKATFDHKWVVAEDDPQLDIISELAGLDVADVIVLPRVGCEAFAEWLYCRVEEHLIDLNQNFRVHIANTTVREHDGNLAGFSPTGGSLL